MHIPEYEIYALKYAGPFTRVGAFLTWLKDWDKLETINYYIWCIQGNDETIIVDAGVSPELAVQKKLEGYVNPGDMLARMGVNANRVRHVVLTHLHWDHVSGVSLFPSATFYVQKDEYDFWMKQSVLQRPPLRQFFDESYQELLLSLKGTKRLVLLRGDRQLVPGIECVLTPGHSVALQAVAVNTSKGTAVLGSDCGHLFRNYREEWPSALIMDLVAWMASYEKLRERASSLDLLFPGHDPLMSEAYPEIAEGITRLV